MTKLLLALALVAIAALGVVNSERLRTLEQRQFHGYLYALNSEGKWDRLRSSQIDLCRKEKCAVLLLGNEFGGWAQPGELK